MSTYLRFYILQTNISTTRLLAVLKTALKDLAQILYLDQILLNKFFLAEDKYTGISV